MHSAINQRIIQGFGANAYGQAVIILTQLIGVPILLYFWGARLYGEWLILSALPIYLSMMDLGFAQSAANDMTQRVARGDHDGAMAVFQSIGALIALSSLAGIAAVIVFVPAIPLQRLLHIQFLHPREASWVLGMLSVEVLIMTNEGTLHAGFRAYKGYALHTAMNSSAILLQHIFLWVFAALGGGPVAGSAAFLGVRLAMTTIAAGVLVKFFPRVTIGLSKANWKILVPLFRPAVANLALPLAQGLNIQGFRLAVGASLGPVAVVTFTTLRTLSRLILQSVSTVVHASEPEMAAAYGSGSINLFRILYARVNQVAIGLSLILSTLLWWSGEWILSHWTHDKVMMDAALFFWLLASSVTNSFWYCCLTVLKAANRHLRAALYYVVSAGLGVLLVYTILSMTKRLANAGFALLVLDFVLLICFVPSAWRLLGDRQQQFVGKLLKLHLSIPEKFHDR